MEGSVGLHSPTPLYAPLHSPTLPYTALHCPTLPYYTPLHSPTLPQTPLHSTTLRYTALHSPTLPCPASSSTPLQARTPTPNCTTCPSVPCIPLRPRASRWHAAQPRPPNCLLPAPFPSQIVTNPQFLQSLPSNLPICAIWTSTPANAHPSLLLQFAKSEFPSLPPTFLQRLARRVWQVPLPLPLSLSGPSKRPAAPQPQGHALRGRGSSGATPSSPQDADGWCDLGAMEEIHGCQLQETPGSVTYFNYSKRVTELLF